MFNSSSPNLPLTEIDLSSQDKDTSEGISIGFKNVLAINQNTEQSNSPPRPASIASLSVISPLLVDTTAIPNPPLICGISFFPTYSLNPGLLNLLISLITVSYTHLTLPTNREV